MGKKKWNSKKVYKTDKKSIVFAKSVEKQSKIYKNQFGNYNSRNATVRMPLIEDNDDEDMYPDTMLMVAGVLFKGDWVRELELQLR